MVDDEPDNLDLLYRTFRRSFQVMRAESGREALDILKDCGEVAVIISDQRMPEMKGTEFLSQTVPKFPDTVRIILTGFTDVEDLVEAINAGQVYRYITKPWEPDELKRVVEQAVNTYGALKQRGDAMHRCQQQQVFVSVMAEIAQRASDAEAALPDVAKAIQTSVGSQGCRVCLVAKDSLSSHAGTAGNFTVPCHETTSLAANAIASRTTETVKLETGICWAAPVIFRDKTVAVVFLAWGGSPPPADGTQDMVHVALKQTALLLACL